MEAADSDEQSPEVRTPRKMDWRDLTEAVCVLAAIMFLIGVVFLAIYIYKIIKQTVSDAGAVESSEEEVSGREYEGTSETEQTSPVRLLSSEVGGSSVPSEVESPPRVVGGASVPCINVIFRNVPPYLRCTQCELGRMPKSEVPKAQSSQVPQSQDAPKASTSSYSEAKKVPKSENPSSRTPISPFAPTSANAPQEEEKVVQTVKSESNQASGSSYAPSSASTLPKEAKEVQTAKSQSNQAPMSSRTATAISVPESETRGAVSASNESRA
uniref:Flocculation protein FLO11-like n=1 Tax=Haemonchus contortus TaxID=6289 RepID=A0A7I4Y2R4_HAECO